MAASETALNPPYLVETWGRDIEAFQSISLQPLKRHMSFEELRLEHYNVDSKEPILQSRDSSNLMAMGQLPSLSAFPTRKSIRAVAGSGPKYALNSRLRDQQLTGNAGWTVIWLSSSSGPTHPSDSPFMKELLHLALSSSA
jgi:hypothetical protein